MSIRFAFDLGTSSLGWAVYQLDDDGRPKHLDGLGSRIFSSSEAGAGREAKSGESKAKGRREARAMRRGHDRRQQRYKHVTQLLVESGLWPDDPAGQRRLAALNPYTLRAAALTEALPLHHVGRAIWHINKHRGFKSNRKTDDPNETGKISSAAKRLGEKMTENRFETYGAFLAARQADSDVRKRKAVRIRQNAASTHQNDDTNSDQNSKKNSDLYEFYPLRDMIVKEFDLICERQTRFNPGFPDADAIEALRSAVFFQRPLKPVEPGYCSFYPNEQRLMKAHPDAEAFVIYQKLNELRMKDAQGYPLPMTRVIRDEIAAELLAGKNVSWTPLRKKFGLGKDEGQISLERKKGPTGLEGSAMTRRFKTATKGKKATPAPFPKDWDAICNDPVRTNWLLEIYSKAQTDEQLERGLQPLLSSLGLEFDENQLAHAMTCRLPDGYLSISKKALDPILKKLKEDVITYAEACERAGLHHSDKRDSDGCNTLRFYNEIKGMKRFLGYGTGNPKDPHDVRFGRIANPTVHVGLNQLRRLTNAMITQYGRPDEIVLELSRDLKKNKKQKEEIEDTNNKNRKANDARKAALAESGFYQPGDRARTREALQRMRLWEELGDNPDDRRCPYSGEQITSIAVLMSDAVEIEHILPRSRTLDDSMANKTVALREYNRLKRNSSPAEAARRHPDKFSLDEMIARTKTMPKNKSWRFHEDAMKRFEAKDHLPDRLLNETRYLSRVARDYLSRLSPASPDEEMKVWVTSGRLTAELRRKWGLNLGTNYKNRNDHRHHALDAAVIGVTDRGLVQRLSREADHDEQNECGRILADISEPYDGFSDQVNRQVRKVFVSHRPDHRVTGQMHDASNYGKVRENDTNLARGEQAMGNLVIRRDILSLTKKQIDQIRDPKLREELLDELYDAKALSGGDKKEEKKALQECLKAFQKRTGIRRVRCLYTKENAVATGKDQNGQAYKYAIPSENLFVDIVELDDGDWKMVGVDIFEAYQARRETEKARKAGAEISAQPKWQREYPGARFIMRLYKGDTLQLFDKDGVNRIKRVVSLKVSNSLLYLADHNEAGNLQKRHDDKDDPFRWDWPGIKTLKKRRARRVRVDATGRIRCVPHGKL